MSTLTVTNIKATGETASRGVSGVAAAWVSFYTTPSTGIRGSRNVSSLTDQGVGSTLINFSNNFATNAGYAATGGQTTTSGGSVVSTGPTIDGAEQTVSSSRFLCVNNTGTQDRDYQAASYHGDLA